MINVASAALRTGYNPYAAIQAAGLSATAGDMLFAVETALYQNVFFMHVPKCAGTSFKAAIEQATGLSRFHHVSPAYGLPAPPELPSRAVVFGSFGWGIHQQYGVKPRYTAVLRHPVARAWSLYQYMRRMIADAPLYRDTTTSPLWRADRLSLAEMTRTGVVELNNQMTSMLAGRALVGPDDHAALAMAKAHLAEFEWLAVMELGFDLPELASVLEVDALTLPTLNTSDDAVMPDSDRQEIIDRNALDLELYSYAVDLVTWRRRQASFDRPGRRAPEVLLARKCRRKKGGTVNLT